MSLDLNPMYLLKERTRQDYSTYKLTSAQLNKVGTELQQVEAGKLNPDQVNGELESYEKDPSAPGKDADLNPDTSSYLGLKNFASSLSDDKPWSIEERALFRRLGTPEELTSSLEAPATNRNSSFVDALQHLLPTIDTDKNGAVSLAELDGAMAEPSYGGADAAALATARVGFAFLSENVHGTAEMSGADVAAFEALKGKDQERTQSELEDAFEKGSQLAGSLKPAPPIEQENIDPLGSYQYGAGSCMLLSSAAGLSKQDLQSMFSSNPDGTIQVHFADGVQETVRDLTTSERLYQARGENNERWPGILEMAFGQRISTEKADHPAPRSAINGVNRQEALRAMTGKGSVTTSLDDISVSATRSLLFQGFSDKSHIVADTCTTDHADDLSQLHNGLVEGHAYTVLAYDPFTDQVTLRNPWHRKEWVVNQDGKDDGIFKMPLKQFYSSYSNLTETTASEKAA